MVAAYLPHNRTYLYKLTSDRGGAPCAPPPRAGAQPLLSLSICKPAIRRTAQPGDRILGVTGQALVSREGYPPAAVIYAAIVSEALDAREYYASRSRFRSRPDCIYQFHRENGTLLHAGTSPLHAEEAYRARDVGQYPYYKNGRTLLSREFRYFGKHALELGHSYPLLRQEAEALGQGHRVYTHNDVAANELSRLFEELWRFTTRHTPAKVDKEAKGHVPILRKKRHVAEAFS